MDKRLLAAVALSIGVLLLFQWLFPAPVPEPRTVPLAPPAAVAEIVPPPAAPALPVAPAVPVAAGAEERIAIETDLHHVTFTNRGGRVESWRLKSYRATDGTPIEVVPEFALRDAALPLAIDLDDRALTDEANAALFQVERREATDDSGGRSLRLVFTWANADGAYIEKSFEFRDGTYLVDIGLEASLGGRALPARLTLGPGFAARHDDSPGQFHYTGQLVVRDRGLVTRVERGDQVAEERRSAAGIDWVGLEEQYFAAVLIPEPAAGDVVIRPVTPSPTADVTEPDTETAAAVPVGPAGARLFVGPKKFTVLRSLGRGLEDVVWFSNYGLVSWLARYLFLALLWIHDHVFSNWGVALILLTFALRVVLFPLNQYSMINMRKMQTQMQRIQPKISAVKNRYKQKKDAESRKKMNEEMMALYQREGVNPMGGVSGCLPILAQFPILIAFYDVLITAVELHGAPFVGWIRDLTLKDPLYITPLLMGATMFLQQKMSTTKSTDPAQAQQQRIMLMMPVIFTVTFLNLPSGLVLYWFVNNLLGILQQWLVNRQIGRLEPAPQKA
jgi:YidC/Oxa1 family membrane protein insertase